MRNAYKTPENLKREDLLRDKDVDGSTYSIKMDFREMGYGDLDWISLDPTRIQWQVGNKLSDSTKGRNS
jgi:hypothetical protein